MKVIDAQRLTHAASTLLCVFTLAIGGVAEAQPKPTQPVVTPSLIGNSADGFFISWAYEAAPDAGSSTTATTSILEREALGGGGFHPVADVTGLTQKADHPNVSGDFRYRIVTYDSASGYSAEGPPSSVVTVDLDKPQLPPSFTATRNLVTGAIDLTWQAASDQGSGVTGYYFAADHPVHSAGREVGNVLATSHPETGPATPGIYALRVKAIDKARNFGDYTHTQFELPSNLALHTPSPTVVVGEPFTLQIKATNALNSVIPFDANVRLWAEVNGDASPALLTVVGSQDSATVRMSAESGGATSVTVTLNQAGVFDLLAVDSLVPSIVGRFASLTAVDPAPPVLATNVNLRATVGQPYVLNGARALIAEGPGELRYSRCGGPENFYVDAVSGAVRWTPERAGPVPLCVIASNGAGSSPPLSFTVEVGTVPAAELYVTFRAAPDRGPPGLQVLFDATGSSGAPGEGLHYLWDFGDGSAPVTTSEPLVEHVYLLPGSHLATLTVFDELGNQKSSRTHIAVTDSSGARPPLAKIVASKTTGEGALSVKFSCDCVEGDAPITALLWELDERTVLGGKEVEFAFGPGRYQVRLTVVDANGLPAIAEQEIVVSSGGHLPPECSASVSPTAGPVPLVIDWEGRTASGSGTVLERTWTFGNGEASSGAKQSFSYTSAGWREGIFTAVDDHGLRCVARRSAVALAPDGLLPPKLLLPLEPERVQCGRAYAGFGAQALPAIGSRPLQWTPVSAPEGLTLDASSGSVSWSPSLQQKGDQQLLLSVSNAAGSAEQPLPFDVSCGETLKLETPLGCSASGPLSAAWLLSGLCLLWALRRRR